MVTVPQDRYLLLSTQGQTLQDIEGELLLEASDRISCVCDKVKKHGEHSNNTLGVRSSSQAPGVACSSRVPWEKSGHGSASGEKREAGKNAPSVQTGSSSSLHSDDNTSEKIRRLRSIIWQRHSTMPITDSQQIL
ncbi:hypothetical protein HJG60_011352 [Phyllostomus discolor]|uniref:Uncharacterized protein n=1 Tax=Phyllostomus discolor TaxID=89673 RepID=A0A834E5I1_9CHIR|nr:hypothetical protein HJG60_011352 [Phyllostomus discolor]